MLALSENLESSAKFVTVSLLSIAMHATFFLCLSRLSAVAETQRKTFIPIHLEIESETPRHPELVEGKKSPLNVLSKKPTVKTKVKPVLGLPPDSLSKKGDGIAVPIGNTTMHGDEGQRLDKVEALPPGEDLSTQPQLIRSSVEIPEYTQDALDNNIVGTFEINVYVEESGVVTKVELTRKIGYGMDEKVIAAAKKVRFVAAKDQFGKDIAQWTRIKFRLEIP